MGFCRFELETATHAGSPFILSKVQILNRPAPVMLIFNMLTRVVSRTIDSVISLVALVFLSPLFLLVALGIWLSSPGTILYTAQRVGLGGKEFTIYKFRTMHTEQRSLTARITARNDARVFRLGFWLRRLKIDELPQLINVLKGDMAIVGPRPEDPDIVSKYYGSTDRETLSILPGLASPGSIYNYTHGEDLLTENDVERCYVERLLPLKLRLDIVYVRAATPFYNLRIIARAVWVILSGTLGRHHFSDPPEMKKAVELGLISQ